MHEYNKPLISLIICTYNRDKYLPEALESIRLQTVDSNKFELLIIDNNSTDNTSLIAKNFIKLNTGLTVKYIFELNIVVESIHQLFIQHPRALVLLRSNQVKISPKNVR